MEKVLEGVDPELTTAVKNGHAPDARMRVISKYHTSCLN